MQGDAAAQAHVGLMYLNGNAGFPKDYAEAAKWSRKAADQGNSSGQLNIGLMYYTGRGLPQDKAEAKKWLRLADASLSEADTPPASQNDLVDPFAPVSAEANTPPAARNDVVDSFVPDPVRVAKPKFIDFDTMPETSQKAPPVAQPQNSGTVALSTKPPSAAAQKGISPKGATWSDYVSVFLIWLIEASVPSCFLYAICWVFMRKCGGTTISISAGWHTLGITFAAVTSALARMATVVLLGGGVGANPKGGLHTFYFVVIPMLSAIIAISFLKKRKQKERSQN